MTDFNLDITGNLRLFDNQDVISLKDAVEKVQKYISTAYSDVLRENETDQQSQSLIKSYIAKYIADEKIVVSGYEDNSLEETIYNEMVGLSLLTQYLDPSRTDVEEINVNAWNDIKITYGSGEILPSKEKFFSPDHAVDVIRRLLHSSKMIFDAAMPIVVGHLNNKVRITAMGEGVIDRNKGVAVSIRIVNPKKLTNDQFVQYGTATPEMLDFLEYSYCYGISMCITGATSSGKTTLMCKVLDEVPHHKRLVTIEQGCREFDCTVMDDEGHVLNNVIHLITRPSDIENQNVTQIKLLETALTINPDNIAVAEMKGGESFLAISAANTGHAVITTIHANSCYDTYSRMVTLCKFMQDMGDETLMGLATQAFPIVAFCKKLEDNTRRIMEITECEGVKDGRPKMRTLFQFKITGNTVTDDGKTKILGHYEKVNNPSEHILKRLRENGMPIEIMTNLFGAPTC